MVKILPRDTWKKTTSDILKLGYIWTHTQGMSNYFKKNVVTPDHFQSLDNEKWCHVLFKTLPNAGGIVQKTWVPFTITQWVSDCLTQGQLDNYYGTSFNTTASESYLQCQLSICILNKEPKVRESIENLWTFFFFFWSGLFLHGKAAFLVQRA